MIKELALIAITIGTGAVLLGTSFASAYATVPDGCTGDPHGVGVNPATGDPHIGNTGNPHVGALPGCPGGK